MQLDDNLKQLMKELEQPLTMRCRSPRKSARRSRTCGTPATMFSSCWEATIGFNKRSKTDQARRVDCRIERAVK